MTQVWLRRTQTGFVFRSPYDEEMARGIAFGKEVRADLRVPRSGKQHRLYWALIRTVWKHTDLYPSPERLHLAIKMELGVIDSLRMLNGRLHIVPASTNYDKMEQAEFHAHFEQTVQLILTMILPGVPREALIREVYALLNLPYRN